MNPEDELNEKWNYGQMIKKAIETAHTEPSKKTLEEIEGLKTVNSDVLKMLQTHFEEDRIWKEADRLWREKDAEWKDSAIPVIEMGRNLQGFGKVVLYVVVFVSAVGGAIFTVIELGKKWLQK